MVLKGISLCPVASFTKYGLGFKKKRKEGTPEIGLEQRIVTKRGTSENHMFEFRS